MIPRMIVRLAVLTLTALFVFAAQGFLPPTRHQLADFDHRPVGSGPGDQLSPGQAAALAALQGRLPKVQVSFDRITGTPRLVAARDGFLTGKGGRGRAVSETGAARYAPRDPLAAAKVFLEEHRQLFGHGSEVLTNAQVQRDYITPHNGLHTTVWQQQLDDLPVYQAVLLAHTSRDGELVSIASQFVADAEQAANAGVTDRAKRHQPKVSAREAVAAAANALEEPVRLNDVTLLDGLAGNPPSRLRFRAPPFNREVTAHLVWLPMNRALLRLCWQVELASRARGETYRVVVDANSAQPWLRQCLTVYLSPASFRVFTNDSPTPFSPGYTTPLTNQPPLVGRTLLTLSALDTNASPAGWIDDGVNETRGNNVDAHLDRNADDLPDLPRPQGSPFRVFDFPLDLTQGPSAYESAAVVQLFYRCNWMHDRLYQLGFTEAAGNFQNDNFGRGGLGNDAVQAEAQDGLGDNNSNFTPTADGDPPVIQMYRFTGPSPNRDGDFDSEVVCHEYTHGLSSRLVGGGVGIFEPQTQAMGEGWSDWYALTLLSEPGDDVDGCYPAGAYASYLIALGFSQNYYFGSRRYPYSTDLAKNPLTFKDIDPARASAHAGIPFSPAIPPWVPSDEPHNAGEVWCVTLWQARANLIHKLGYATGNQLILQLVTDGMKLSPPNPNFLEARDAILQADRIDTGGANQAELWQAFAKRGLGFSAESPPSSTTAGLFESFDPADALLITPRHLTNFSGLVGGPFAPRPEVLTLTNQGSAPLQWAAAPDFPWLTVSPSGGMLQPGGPAATVTLTAASVANALAGGTYANLVRFTNLNTSVMQQRSVSLLARPSDYLTEVFSDGNFDLSYKSVTFTPDGLPAFYGVCAQTASTFPTDPAGGSNVISGEAYVGSTAVALPPGVKIWLFGSPTNFFEIDVSGGGLLIPSANNDQRYYFDALKEHFNLPRVSALYQDASFFGNVGFYIDYDTIVGWKPGRDRVAVTFQRIYDASNLAPSDFQIEMFFDGRVRITYLAIGAQGGVAGLSRGQGLPSAFVSSDFSASGPCLPELHLVLPTSTVEGAGVLNNAGQVWVASPLPTNLVVSLASSAPAEVQVPTQVTLLSGVTSASFNLTVTDDTVLDGTQRPDIIASAPGFASGAASISVFDRQTTALLLNLPAAVTEGDAPAQGTVRISSAPAADVAVTLSSSDPTRVQVDPSAIILAGHTSAVFSVSAVDDYLVNGSETVTITAQVAGWAAGSAALTVRDNETNLWVDLISGLAEDSSTRTNAGTVRLDGFAVSNLTITLQSSVPSRLRVPASVVIPANSYYASFDLTPLDDSVVNGPQRVAVFASGAGLATGSNSLMVYDNEMPILPFAPQPPDLASNVHAQLALSWVSTEGDLIVNGGFESGDFSGWTLFNFYGSGGFVINDGTIDPPGPEGPTPPRAGRFSALGQASGSSWCELQQLVTLPAQASAAELQWTHRVRNYATGFSNESFTVQIDDPSGNPHAAFWTLPGDPLLQDWTTHTFDLGPFLGQTILVRFVLSSTTTNIDVGLDDVGVRLHSTGPTLYWVYFGDQPGAVQLLGTTTNTSWPLPLLPPLTTYYWQVVAQRGTTANPAVWRFTTRGLDHFDWSAIAPLQTVNSSFPITLTARDDLNRPVTNFRGPASLRGLIAPVPTPSTIVVTEVGRVEAIYNEHHWVELMNVSTAPIALDGWQVTFYSEASWPAPTGTLPLPPGTSVPPGGVFTIEELGDPPGAYPKFFTGGFLTVFSFADPVTGVLVRDSSGAIVDFFAGGDVFEAAQIDPGQITDPVIVPNSQWSGPAATGDTSTLFNPSFQRVGNLDQNNAWDWTVAEASQGTTNDSLTVPFAGALRSVAISPVSAPSFTNGVWAGQLTVQEPATDMQLEGAASPVSSRSAQFSVLLRNDVGLTMTGIPNPVAVGQDLTYVLTVKNYGPYSAPGVVVTNTLSVPVSSVYAAASQGAFNASPTQVTFSLGDLAADALATLVFAVAPVSSGWLTNNAVVTHYGLDSYASDDTAQAITAIMPVITVGNSTNFEGNAGTTPAAFPVTLSSPFQWPVTVNYATTNGTAQARNDYLPAWGQLVIPPGITATQITVNIRGDLQVEPDETFFLNLSSPSNATLANSQAIGVIRNDDGVPGAIASLVWSNMPSPLLVKHSVPAVLQALDASGNPATNFSGVVSLSARAVTPDTNQVGGNGFTWFWEFPLGASHRDQRTEAIYPAGELPGPARILSLALDVRSLPHVTLSNWTIRLKHTNLESFAHDSQFRYAWDAEGWTLVYQSDVVLTNPGWITFVFQTPFDYNGTNNLMLDLSFHNPASGLSDGNCYLTMHDRGLRTLYASAEGEFGDPLTWTGSAPLPVAHPATPDLKLVVQHILPVLPSSSGNFTRGSWSGPLAVQAPGTGFALAADDGNGHAGLSNPLDVLLTDDVGLGMTATPSQPVVGQPLTYALWVTNTGPSTATGVFVTNWLPPGAAFSFASASQGSYSVGSNTVVFNLGALAGSSLANLTLTVSPLASGHLTNLAVVTRAEPDNYTGNNFASVRTDVLPTATVSDATVFEGNVGLTPAAFTVTLSGTYDQQVQIHYETSGGTATPNVDFASTFGDLYFNPGTTSQVVTVEIIGDISVEPVEMFYLDLTAVTNVVLARAQAIGSILNDDGFPGDPWSLQWGSLGPRYVGESFPATLTARDTAGALATNFTGQVALSAWVGAPITNLTGSGVYPQAYPLGDYFLNERAQVIYLPSELGGSGELTALALNLESVPGRVFTNWTIRLKHTKLSSYSSYVWETNDWLVVLQTNLQVTTSGWAWLPFQIPFNYDGYDNLMVDFSFFGQASAPGSGVLASSVGVTRVLEYASFGFDDPRLWSGASPFPIGYSYVPNLQLLRNLRGSPLAIQPPLVGPFTNGVWAGTLSLAGAGSPVVLQADDGQGHLGFGTVEIRNPPMLLGERYAGSLVLFWPALDSEFVLQSSRALAPSSWTVVPGAPLLIGDFFIVPVDISDPRQFYRLRLSRP